MSHDPTHPHPPAHAHSHETPPLHDPADQWHDHSTDERPQQAHGEVGNAPAIMGIGVALFFVIVFAVVAVYAYYMWFLAQRLNEQEVAFGNDAYSPATIARQYKRDSIRRLDMGGTISIKATETLPALNYTLSKIDDSIKSVAETYSKASTTPSPRSGAAGQ